MGKKQHSIVLETTREDDTFFITIQTTLMIYLNVDTFDLVVYDILGNNDSVTLLY